MNSLTPLKAGKARTARMLLTAFGTEVTGPLQDADVLEVMLNPDGSVWLDRLSTGLEATGDHIGAADGERIVRLVAHHVGVEVDEDRPRVSAELPGTGERFEGLLPPVVSGPAFAIRKPAVAIFGLADYVAAGIMPDAAAATLREAVLDRKNILVVGGTSTGKTTLVNALLAVIADSADRIILIEDTRDGYANAVQVYAFDEGALFQVYAAPGQITDIALQPGESLSASGPVAAGDTARWIIGDTVSGTGVTARVHILVKPTRPALRTNLIINTDRRTYHVELRSTASTAMASVSWRYPQDELIALQAATSRPFAVCRSGRSDHLRRPGHRSSLRSARRRDRSGDRRCLRQRLGSPSPHSKGITPARGL